MKDESAEPEKYQSLRQTLRSRRRDDFALNLFRQAEAELDDIWKVDRVLLELGRCYNPLTNAPIVDLATRRRIIECLHGGRQEEARRLIDGCLAAYARLEVPEQPSEEQP